MGIFIYLFIHLVCAVGACVIYMRYAVGSNERLDSEDFMWMLVAIVVGPLGLFIAIIATVAERIEDARIEIKNPFYKEPK